MADDDNNQNQDDNNDQDANGPEQPVRASFRELAKLAGTILITLIIFAALVRGCASCQSENPFTGEPIRQVPPAPGQ